MVLTILIRLQPAVVTLVCSLSGSMELCTMVDRTLVLPDLR